MSKSSTANPCKRSGVMINTAALQMPRQASVSLELAIAIATKLKF